MLVAAFEDDGAGMLEEERGRPIRWLFAVDQVNGKKEVTLGDTMMMKAVRLERTGKSQGSERMDALDTKTMSAGN